MKHHALNQADIDDLLRLVTSPALSIGANMAARVHELQAKLSTPPAECDECIALRRELLGRIQNEPCIHCGARAGAMHAETCAALTQ